MGSEDSSHDPAHNVSLPGPAVHNGNSDLFMNFLHKDTSMNTKLSDATCNSPLPQVTSSPAHIYESLRSDGFPNPCSYESPSVVMQQVATGNTEEYDSLETKSAHSKGQENSHDRQVPCVVRSNMDANETRPAMKLSGGNEAQTCETTAAKPAE